MENIVNFEDQLTGYEKIERLIRQIDAHTTEAEMREIFQEMFFIVHDEKLKKEISNSNDDNQSN